MTTGTPACVAAQYARWFLTITRQSQPDRAQSNQPTVNSRLAAGVLGRTLDAVPPAAGAWVMGTAIVSLGLSLDGREVLSRVILAIAVAIWATLRASPAARRARPNAFSD